MIAFKLSSIRSTATNRPQGYYDACVAAGRIEGDKLLLSPEAYDDLQRRFSPPGAGTMAWSLANALSNEAMAIAQRKAAVTPEEKARRLTLCEDCEFWIAASRRCAKCGCWMDRKAGLRSARCPAGKW